MTQQHIDDDTLSLFVKNTSRSSDMHTGNHSIDDSLYNDVIEHLAYCEECRNQVSTISMLDEKWCDIHQQSQLSDDQHRLICDYLDGSLSVSEAGDVKALIESHPDAMKAALHYQSHSALMHEALASTDAVSKPGESTTLGRGSLVSSFTLAVRQFFNIRSPMIYTMTATTALFIVVLLLTQTPEMQQEQVMVAAYQDNPSIQFTDANKLPGVGFFTQSGSTSKPYEDVTVELVAEDTIKITWPVIQGAELYKMRIQVFNQGKKTVLKEKSSQTNHTTFQLQPVNLEDTDKSHNKRYEWVLYGNTSDDRMFYATGGFVVSRIDTGNDYDTW